MATAKTNTVPEQDEEMGVDEQISDDILGLAADPYTSTDEITSELENPNKDAGKEDESGNNIYKGLFNFQDAFDAINNWPADGEDDPLAEATKATMMSEYIQSGMDNLQAKDMAYTNSAIAATQMQNAANLELRNTSQTMYDTFRYNTLSKGDEYNLQTRFANNQAKRDNTARVLEADLRQNQTILEGEVGLERLEEEGYQTRENIIEQKYQERLGAQEAGYQRREDMATSGYQERETLKEQGLQNIALSEVQSQNQLDALKEEGAQRRLGLQEEGSQQRLGITEQSVADISLERARGSQARQAQVIAGDQDIRRTNAQALASEYKAGAEGTQDRLNIKEQNIADVTLAETAAQNRLDEIGAQSDANLVGVAQQGLQGRLGIMEQNIADLNMAQATGAQTRLTLETQGGTDIKKMDAKARADAYVTRAQGEQQREGIKEQNIADIMLTETSAQNTLDQIYAGSDASVRNINATGKNTREGIQEQNIADLKMREAEGVQNRKTIGSKNVADINVIEETGEETRANIAASGEQSVRQIRESGDQSYRRGDLAGSQAVEQIQAKGVENRAMQGMYGEQSLEQIGAKGDVSYRLQGQRGGQEMDQLQEGGTQTRQTMRVKGEEDRALQDNSARIEAARRADQSRYSRGLARSF